MRDNILRLRLVVRRHALPDVRIVFAVQLDNDPTIASLLERINEIIPLESDDWSLEDYVVQLRDSAGHGFDCLHFQPVSTILKNDEEVLIRPLDTGDRRKRRLTGRDQISTDGRHLIDGVAFGRPRFRAPRDRPPIKIPPLTRQRVTYEAEESEEEEPRFLLTEYGEADKAGRRVRIRAPFEDDEDGEYEEDLEHSDQDPDEDGQGSLNEDVEEDLQDELRDLEADNERFRGATSVETKASKSTNRRPAHEGSIGLDLETLDKITALRAAFPAVPVDTCERTLALHDGSITSAYFKLRTAHQPLMSLDAMLAHIDSFAPRSAVTEQGEAEESEAESVSSMVKHYDHHGFPSGSILAGTAATQMAETMRKSGHPVKAPVHTKFDEHITTQVERFPLPPVAEEGDGGNCGSCDGDYEIEYESDNDEEHKSDAGSDSVDGDSDSGPEVQSSKRPEAADARLSTTRRPNGADDVNNKSGSQSSNEDGSESASDADTSSDSDRNGDTSDDDDNDDSSELSDDDNSKPSIDESSDSESGCGSSGNSTSWAQSDDSDSSSSESHSSSDEESPTHHDTYSAHPTRNDPTTSVRPSASRETLVQKTQQPSVSSQAPPLPVPPGQGKTATQRRNARRRAALKAQKAAAVGEGPPAADSPATIAVKKESLLERLRFLQQALPDPATGTSNEDHTQVSVPARAATPDSPAHNRATGSPGSWRDKIIYRGVECCHDGVELSEPPFPFVQRWDPQQQYCPNGKNQRGGRSKRKERNQPDFVDQGSRSNIKRRRYAGDSLGYEADEDDNGESYINHNGDTGFGVTVLDYDDAPGQTIGPGEQAPSQTPDEDLPLPPTDVSALPSLQPGMAQSGMVLTWKQLLLSEVSWQPQIFAFTGIVVDVQADDILTVRLAKRDRNLNQKEKVYDEDGNRVYDKFELPGVDDESEEEATAQGYRTLELADMIEPRILRPSFQAARDSHFTKQQPDPEQPGPVQGRGVVPSSDSALSRHDQCGGEPDGSGISSDMNIDTQPGGQSIVSLTSIPQESFGESMPEDCRHEMSLLINDAGSRKEADPSVTANAC
ncbi:hypothetical protein VTI74DRAFT_5728 [Chaetomium olivicolor]